MSRIINCDCGYVVRGATDDEIVANAQAHAREIHGMEIGRDQVLTLVSFDDGEIRP